MQLDVVSYSCASARRLPPRSRSERPPCQNMKDFPINHTVSRAASPAAEGLSPAGEGLSLARVGREDSAHFHPLQNANDFKGEVGRGRLTLEWGAPSASAFALPSRANDLSPEYISLPDAEHCGTRNTRQHGLSGPDSDVGSLCADRREAVGLESPPLGVRNPLN